MDETGHPLAGLQAEQDGGALVVGVPVGDPVGAIAHGIGGDQQVLTDRAGRELLLPGGDVAVDHAGDHHHRQRRIAQLGEGGQGLVRIGLDGRQAFEFAHQRRLGVAFEDQETPGEQLAVIGRPRRQADQLVQLLRGGAGSGQLGRGG